MNERVAVITGGGRGIGRGIVLGLAREGWSVAVNYRGNLDAANEAVRQAEAAGAPRTLAVQADISSDADRQRLVDEVLGHFGRIDLLVNNAGMAPRVRLDILETTEASYDEVMDVNLKGPFFLSQLVANSMIGLLENGMAELPKIVNISSISAFTASPNRGEYCISKAGMSMMTALFADRLAVHGINVYEIRPGVTETDMTSKVKATYDALIDEGLTPIRRWGQPDDIARAVVAIAQDLFPFSTGEIFNVDGGFHLRRL